VTLYAFEAIDDAVDATRAFLWPFDRGRWARLALLMLFVGGGGVNPLQFGGGGGGTGGGPPASPGTPTPSPPGALPLVGGVELGIVAAVVVVVALLVVGFLLVGSVVEFVFVDSLRREAVAIRRYWSEHWRRGVQLFGFRLVLGVVTLAVVVGLLAVVVGPLLLGDSVLSLGLLVVVVPVLVVVSILTGLVDGFTTMFVVPVMLAADETVLGAWRRFWPTLTGQWKQYAVYAVLGFVLQLVGGILVALATLVGAVVVAIPLGLVGLLGAGLFTVAEVAGIAVAALAVLLLVVGVVVLSLVASVPVQTFLRYYALFVLGDTDEAFDLIPERRRAVRAE
jgi:hypothetical protein